MLNRLRPRSRIVLYFTTACAAYIVFMNVVCMLLRPQLFDHPHWGISYFGSQPKTLLPYYGGFVLMISCLLGITYELRRVNEQWRFLYRTFWGITGLAIGIALTSSMQGAFLFWAHIIICFILLLVAICADVRALLRPGTQWHDYIWALLLVVGTVLLLLSSDWANILGVYAWSELVLFVATLLALGTAAVRAIDHGE